LKALSEAKITKFHPLGEKFDPETSSAVFELPAGDGEKNMVRSLSLSFSLFLRSPFPPFLPLSPYQPSHGSIACAHFFLLLYQSLPLTHHSRAHTRARVRMKQVGHVIPYEAATNTLTRLLRIPSKAERLLLIPKGMRMKQVGHVIKSGYMIHDRILVSLSFRY
jgi:hypothetical protein